MSPRRSKLTPGRFNACVPVLRFFIESILRRSTKMTTFSTSTRIFEILRFDEG
jgi:hypothetical protein